MPLAVAVAVAVACCRCCCCGCCFCRSYDDYDAVVVSLRFPERAAERFSFRGCGSGGQGVDAKSGRSCKAFAKLLQIVRKAFAKVSQIVRKAFASVGFRCWDENAAFWTRNVSRVSTVTGIGGVVVAKGRTVVAFGLACCPRVSRVSTVTGTGVAKGGTVVT